MYRGDLIAEQISLAAIEKKHTKKHTNDLNTKRHIMYRGDLMSEQTALAAIEKKQTKKHTSK
jgi:hypothetical protein